MTGLQGVLDRALPRGRFVRNVAVLAGGTASAQVLVVLAMPALTRLYTPVEMATLSAFVATLSVISVLGGLCYEQAIPLPEDHRDAARLFVLSALLYLALATATLVAVAVAGGALVAWLKTPALLPFLGLLPVSLLLLGLYQNLTYWAIRRKAFGGLAQSKLSQSLGVISAQAGMGLAGLGPAGLVLGDVIGRACGAGAAYLLIWRQGREAFAAIRPADLRRVAWRYRKFTMGVVPAFLCTVNLQAPVFVIAATFGAPTMAAFALAQQVISTPLQLLGHAVAQAFMAEAAGAPAADVRATKARLLRIMGQMAMLGGLLLGATWVGAPAFFALAFGEGWREAGVVVQYLAPIFVVQLVLSPIGATVQVLERQEVIVVRELLRTGILAVAIAAALRLPGGYHTMLAALSAAGVAAYLTYGAIGWRAIGAGRGT